MRSLVNLTGGFSIDKLKEVLSQAEFLAEQPQLKVDDVFADKNPQLGYREISVSWADSLRREVKYYVMDMGRVNDVSATISIGSKIYSEKEVEELRHSTVKSSYA